MECRGSGLKNSTADNYERSLDGETGPYILQHGSRTFGGHESIWRTSVIEKIITNHSNGAPNVLS